MQITDGFNPGDDEIVISILKKWSGGQIGNELFYTIAGMMPTTGVVVVIIHNPSDPEIIFVTRPSDDPLLKSQLNLPGKLFLNADFNRSDKFPANGPLERITKDEIESDFPKKPEYVGVSLNSDTRGSWAVLVYIIELENKSLYRGVGEWIKMSKISDRKDIIQTEVNHINLVLGKINCTDIL